MPKKTEAPVRRQRRTLDQRIAELEAKVAAIKEREARKLAKADPALRHVSAALKSIDKALAEADGSDLKKALGDARDALTGCLGGEVVPAKTRSARAAAHTELAEALLAYVRSNPGQRGEQIAAALGTDANTMRPAMKRLISAGKVATEGQRRGMTYAAL